MKPEIILTSTLNNAKVYINTNTICAYWRQTYKDVEGNGYAQKTQTNVLFTNGKTFSYVELPEMIHAMIYTS